MADSPTGSPLESGRPDIRHPRRVHVIGAGGSGMSAIASVLLATGHHVTGSDAADSTALRRLADQGAEVHVGHDPAWVDDADLVVRSTAIGEGNVEVVEARRRSLTVWRRSQVLAALCALRRTVAVSGTHGKTTTSAMLALLLREAGLHPSMIVGGDIAGLGSGAAWDAEGEWFVVEADESDGTFVELGAEAVVVTSVEPDHLDYYGSEAAMRQAFDRFVAQAGGPAVVCADDPGALALAGVARRPGSPATVTYGTSGTADVRVSDVELGRADASFALWVEGAPAGSVSLAVPGLHNVRNAAAAMTMANALGVAWDSAAAAIGLYRGVARRFELRGERDGITFVDDYGHLPSEVAAAIAAARAGGWARIVVVFQPHRYSRTEALWRDFADSFEGADVVVVTDVYPAGEAPRPGVSGELIFAAIRDSHPDADVRYIPTLDAVAHEMARLLVAGDLCLSLGAGDVSKLPDRLLSPGHGVG